MKVLISTDTVGYETKPTGHEADIQDRLWNHTEVVDAQALAEIITEGRTVAGATMKGGRKNFNMVQQQMVMLDFDNTIKVKVAGSTKKKDVKTTGADYITLDKVLNDPFIQDNAVLVYTTFSHKEDWHKLRVVFFLNRPLLNHKQVTALYMKLLAKYPQADKSIKNCNRLFYGGHNYFIMGAENVLEVPQDVLEVKADTTLPKSNEIATGSEKRTVNLRKRINKTPSEIIQMIQDGEISALRSMYNFRTTVPSFHLAVEYLKSINIREVFNLPTTGNFLDLFHAESTPSASVGYITRESGVREYRYTCFSASAEFSGDIFDVFARILQNHANNKFLHVYKLLLQLFDIKVEMNERERAIYDQIDYLIYNLRRPSTEINEYTCIGKALGNNRAVAINILNLIKDYVYVDFDGVGRVGIMMSQRTMAELTGFNQTKISRTFKKMKQLNMVRELPNSEIDPRMLNALEKERIRRQLKFHTSVIEVDEDAEYLDKIASLCSTAINEGAVRDSYNTKAIALVNGNEQADKVQPQREGEYHYSKEDEKMYNKIISITEDLINKEGYATDKEIHKRLKMAYKRKAWSLDEIKGVRGGIIRSLGLVRVRATKATRAEHPELNLEGINNATFIYIKEEY